MSDEEPITGTVFCPKCGFKFSIHKKRLMECQICKKNVYGEYPRIRLVLQSEMYGDDSKPKQCGYICRSCASKLKISTVEAKETEAK